MKSYKFMMAIVWVHPPRYQELSHVSMQQSLNMCGNFKLKVNKVCYKLFQTQCWVLNNIEENNLVKKRNPVCIHRSGCHGKADHMTLTVSQNIWCMWNLASGDYVYIFRMVVIWWILSPNWVFLRGFCCGHFWGWP